MRIILDSSILIHRPDILSRGGVSVKFLLPKAALHEIVKSRFGDHFHRLICEASESGIIEILPDTPSTVPDSVPPTLSTSDIQILSLAIQYRKKNEEHKVIIASDDSRLNKIAEGLEFGTFTSKSIDEILPAFGKAGADSDVLKFLSLLRRANSRYLNISILESVLTIGGICLCPKFIGFFRPHVSIILIWFFVAFIGIIFYLYRSKHRLVYGLVELFFGVLASVTALIYPQLNSNEVTFFFAGLYIIVSGLDNIKTGLEGTPFQKYLTPKI